jgi:hypothetical protein
MVELLKNGFNAFGLNMNSKSHLQTSFLVLQGLVTGIALNDVWRILNLPGNNQPVFINGQASKVYDVDFLYQAAIASVIFLSDVVFHVKGGMAFGSGMLLGSRWANISEHNKYIGMA